MLAWLGGRAGGYNLIDLRSVQELSPYILTGKNMDRGEIRNQEAKLASELLAIAKNIDATAYQHLAILETINRDLYQKLIKPLKGADRNENEH